MTLKEKLNLLPPSYGDYALNISSEFNDGVLTWIIGYEGNYGWLKVDGSTFLFSGVDIELVVDTVFRTIHYHITSSALSFKSEQLEKQNKVKSIKENRNRI
tara:strand:+ start:1410 stop:1712 length:303 start_codon:yes stop_codon:yes gene_type:complete